MTLQLAHLGFTEALTLTPLEIGRRRKKRVTYWIIAYKF